MKKHLGLGLKLREKRGVTIVLVAVLLIVLIGFIALAVDIGYVMVTRNEIQNVADSAALAATRRLGYHYQCETVNDWSVGINPAPDCTTQLMSYSEIVNYVCDSACQQTIISVAQNIALQNKAAGTSISVLPTDVIIGQWKPATKNLTATFNRPDAVRVIARRDGVANGPVTTFFAKLLGIPTVNVSGKATASITSESTVEPGKVIPVGICELWYDPSRWGASGFCDQPIKFYPTGGMEGCAGWNTYFLSNPGGNTNTNILITQILQPWIGGNNPSPGAGIGDEFIFIGGTLTAAMDDFYNVFDYMRTRDDDNNPCTWTAMAPVYKCTSCDNVGPGAVEIVGFSTVVITTVCPPVGLPPIPGCPAPDPPCVSGEKRIIAKVICDNIEAGRGGGGEYGTQGTIPGLVE